MKLMIFLSKFLPLVFWVLLLVAFDCLYVSVLTGLSAVIHECGHLLFASSYKKITFPKADISGFRIKISGMSYKEELITALGGPVINILLGVVLLIFPESFPFLNYVRIFGIINLMTAFSNLLPIEGYDGYRILYCIGALLFDDTGRYEAMLFGFSFLFSALMCFVSLYLVLKIGEGYWIFFVFFSLTLSGIIKRTKHNF